MSNELTKSESSEVPMWMREASKGAAFGNLDASDLKPPRLKVLAGQSPEVMDGIPGATPGNFWLTVLNMNLGQTVTGTPIYLNKSYHLWAPKIGGSEQKGPLATASDAIHWDVPDQTFEVRFQGNPKVYTWRIGKLVGDYNMNKWGSSQDDNPKSKPAATLTYDVLWMIELPDGRRQLCVFTSARTGIQPTQTFLSTARAIGVDQFYQRYRIQIQKRTGPTGDPFFTYQYSYIGLIQDQARAQEMRAIYDQYRSTGFVVDKVDEEEHKRDEAEEVPF